MLEKPDIPDQRIIDCAREAYGLALTALAFLPLGVDVNAAVYRAETAEGSPYFIKLRKAGFEEINVSLPHFLHRQGVDEIIPPRRALDGRLWASLDPYRVIVYPFISGTDGYETPLTAAQWTAFGTAMGRLHAVQLPGDLSRQLAREEYAPRYREMVAGFQARAEADDFAEPVAADLAAFMRANRAVISRLVRRASQLAEALQARQIEFVLCHCDIHPGNLLIPSNEAFYIVDWDNPAFAPKERDLMHIGGSSTWNNPQAARLFFAGYRAGGGQTQVDGQALAYFRYERIIQDIAEFCLQLFDSDSGEDDRRQSYRYFTGQFLPGHEVELAARSDPG